MPQTTDGETTRAASVAWFERWFDSHHYHSLYTHRDGREASRFVDAMVRRLRPPLGSTMLDLGCGVGRHARFLASKGFDVTGLDLSPRSIRKSRKLGRPGLRFEQGDMRVPFGENRFDYIVNLFTSFGYFEGLGEHLVVMRNVADALKPGGRLVLDYLNACLAERKLVPHEEKTLDGRRYRITRWTDEGHFFKKIVVGSPRSTSVEYVERVAKLTLKEFGLLFGLHELRIEEVFGDYAFGPYRQATSPRLIVVARKKPRPAS